MKHVARLAFLISWLACGYLARGYWIGDSQVSFPSQDGERFANICYVFGPLGLMAELLVHQGPWMSHGYSCQKRWEEFQKEGSALSRREFVHLGNITCREEDLK